MNRRGGRRRGQRSVRVRSKSIRIGDRVVTRWPVSGMVVRLVASEVSVQRTFPLAAIVAGRAATEVVLVEVVGHVGYLPTDNLLDALDVAAAAGGRAVEVLTIGPALEGLVELGITLLASHVQDRRAAG